jgi:hypothetical protein
MVVAMTAVELQQASSIPTGRGSIAGRVVESGSDRPLPSVMMTLESVADRGVLNTMTDEGGRYRFEGVGAGGYRVRAALQGYATETWGERDARMTPGGGRIPLGLLTFVMTDGQVRSGVDFVLERGGTVAGRVTGANGQPVKGAMVMSLRLDGDDVPFNGSAQGRTNDGGEYRIDDLRPGLYHVSAIWLDPDRMAARTAETRPTFFPGTQKLEEAISLRVTAGAEMDNVDIRLPPSDRFRIGGHILRTMTEGTIEANLLSGAHSIRTVTIAADGAFDIQHVAAGRHWLWARATTHDGTEAAWMAIDLASDMTGLVLPMMPTAEIRGRVVTADGTVFADAGYQVIAHLVDNDGTKIDVLPRDRVDLLDGRFELRSLFGHRVLGLSGNEWDVERVLIGKTAVETLALHGSERLDDITVVVTRRQR